MHRISLMAFLLTLAPAAHAEAQPTPAPEWIMTSGGNLSVIDGGGSQPAANLSLTHLMGKTSVGLSGTLTASAGSAPVGVTPDHIRTVTLSVGHSFGRGTLIAHVSEGQGFFRHGIVNISPSQPAVVDSKAHGIGVGLLASIDFKLAKNLVFTPSVEADYSKTLLKRIPLDQETFPGEVENKSDGITLAGGGALLRHFGKSRQHALMVMASVIRMTNSSDFIHRTGRVDTTVMKDGSADTFVDYGANISLSLSRNVSVNVNATRSTGYNGPESMVAGAGMQFAF